MNYDNLKEDMFRRWYYHNIIQLKEKGGDDERRRIQQFIVMKDAFKAVFNLGAAFSLKFVREHGIPKPDFKGDENQIEMDI